MKKPKILYHASQNTNLKIINPDNKTKRDEKEGKVVFATPSKALASCFIIPTNDSWSNIGVMNNKPYIIISDKKRFLETDKGGAIYKISQKKFTFDKNKGMKELEWTSKKHIEVIDKEVFDSGLEAMKSLGVNVKFVNKETFEILNRDENKILKILK